MYSVVLDLHSWIRWIALVSGFGATLSVLMSRETSRPSAVWGLALMAALDVQLLLGLLLYFVLSPNMQVIRENFSEAMRTPGLRFWAVEHVSMMLLAVVVVHIGRALARKAATPDGKRLRLLICFAIATIAMLAGTPWPGMISGRPLFRI
jgi:hypothetical protein